MLIINQLRIIAYDDKNLFGPLMSNILKTTEFCNSEAKQTFPSLHFSLSRHFVFIYSIHNASHLVR